MNKNKISIASLAIGLGTVVVVNYVFPLIDTAITAACSKLNVGIVNNQATAQGIAEKAGVDDDKMYSTNAIGFRAGDEEDYPDNEEFDDE